MDYINKVSGRISLELKRNGMSLRDLESRTGISRSTLSRYLNGTNARIPLSKLIKIAEAMNVSSAYLACWTDDPFFTMEEDEKSSPIETDELKVLIDSLSEEKRKQLEMYAKYLASQED